MTAVLDPNARLAHIPGRPHPTSADLDEPWRGLMPADVLGRDWNGDGRFRDGPDAAQHDNTRRAGFAVAALAAYMPLTGSDPETVIADLLGDLRHLCDALNVDFDGQNDSAWMNYQAEIEG